MIDSKLTIDASSYNKAHWKRVPQQPQQSSASTEASSCQFAFDATTGTTTGTTTSTTDSSTRKTGGITGMMRDTGDISAPGLGGSDLQEDGITEADRSGMITKLSIALQTHNEELKRRVAAVRYKRASLDYLYSLVGQTSAESGVQTITPPLPSTTTTNTTTSPLPFSYRIATPLKSNKESIYLKELRQAEALHFQLPPRDNIEEDYEETGLEDNLLINSIPNIDITIESLHYNTICGTTDIQLFAIIYNSSSETVYDVQLCAYSLKIKSNNDNYTVTKSARVPYILPLQRICISAVVRLPTSQYLLQSIGVNIVELRVVASWSHTTDTMDTTTTTELSSYSQPQQQPQQQQQQQKCSGSDLAEIEALKVLHRIVPSK